MNESSDKDQREVDRAVEVAPAESSPPPAFREVFEREVPFVYNSLRRLGIRPSDLADVTQEVFVTVASILPDYDPTRPIRPWLFGIAYRVGLRYAQAAYRRREVPSQIPDSLDPRPAPDASVESGQVRDRVRAALEKVEPSRRAVLLLAYFDDMSVPEIAATLQIPLNTAYSRLHRARQEFAEAARRVGLSSTDLERRRT